MEVRSPPNLRLCHSRTGGEPGDPATKQKWPDLPLGLGRGVEWYVGGFEVGY